MKQILIISTFFFSFLYGRTQVMTDTLQWLKTNIEQKSSSFDGMPAKTNI
jgi:hypothetical protein